MVLLHERKVACRAIIAGPQNEGEFLESLRKYIRDEKLDIQFVGYMPSEKAIASPSFRLHGSRTSIAT